MGLDLLRKIAEQASKKHSSMVSISYIWNFQRINKFKKNIARCDRIICLKEAMGQEIPSNKVCESLRSKGQTRVTLRGEGPERDEQHMQRSGGGVLSPCFRHSKGANIRAEWSRRVTQGVETGTIVWGLINPLNNVFQSKLWWNRNMGPLLWVWWLTSVNSAPRKPSQEDFHEFEISLGYNVRCCPKELKTPGTDVASLIGYFCCQLDTT